MPLTWFNPSGGLGYHLLAARAATRQWQPFRHEVARWLQEWPSHKGELVLVGPSAGYTLEDAFFRRFAVIWVVEPDPLAWLLLHRRLNRLEVTHRWVRQDLLVQPLLRPGVPHLREWLRAHPRAEVLFANVLGQLRFLVPEENWASWIQRFQTELFPDLRTRTWASYHDRLSAALPPLHLPPRVDHALTTQSLSELYARPDGSVPLELLDHGTEELFPVALPRRYWLWPLSRRAWHVIEGVSGSG